MKGVGFFHSGTRALMPVWLCEPAQTPASSLVLSGRVPWSGLLCGCADNCSGTGAAVVMGTNNWESSYICSHKPVCAVMLAVLPGEDLGSKPELGNRGSDNFLFLLFFSSQPSRNWSCIISPLCFSKRAHGTDGGSLSQNYPAEKVVLHVSYCAAIYYQYF